MTPAEAHALRVIAAEWRKRSKDMAREHVRAVIRNGMTNWAGAAARQSAIMEAYGEFCERLAEKYEQRETEPCEQLILSDQLILA